MSLTTTSEICLRILLEPKQLPSKDNLTWITGR